MVIIAPGTPLQPMVATLLLLMFVLLVLKTAPYESESADWANFIATMSLLLTTLGGFALTMNRGEADEAAATEAEDSTAAYYNFTALAPSASAMGDEQEECET